MRAEVRTRAKSQQKHRDYRKIKREKKVERIRRKELKERNKSEITGAKKQAGLTRDPW